MGSAERLPRMRNWVDCGLAPMRMAINVSAANWRRDFCEMVTGALAESGP